MWSARAWIVAAAGLGFEAPSGGFPLASWLGSASRSAAHHRPCQTTTNHHRKDPSDEQHHAHRPAHPGPRAAHTPQRIVGSAGCASPSPAWAAAAADEPGYINVSAFGNPGEAAARVLSKGWLVAVDGRLQYGEWQTEDNGKRHDYEIVGNVEFLAAPRGSESTNEEPVPVSAAADEHDQVAF